MTAEEIPVLILAGGKGTRIKHLLNELPKPMYPVLEVPFLDYQIAYLKRYGFRTFYISTGYKAEVIEDYYKNDAHIFFIREEQPLGTGGAILKCLQEITASKVLVLNGDTLFLMDYAPFLELSNNKGMRSIIALKMEKDPSRYGSVKLDEDSKILSFSEKMDQTNTYSLINAGIYLLATEQLKNMDLPEVCSIETDIFPLLTKKGIFGFETEAEFIDIGTPETLFQIEEFVQKNNIKPL